MFGTLLLLSGCLLAMSLFIPPRPMGPTASESLLSKEQTVSLKGIAIVFVLFTHISHSPYRLSALPGALGVCTFLVLSGFGLHRSYRAHELKGFLSKRSRTVLVPYWLVVIVLATMRWESVEAMELILLGSLASFPEGIHGWFLQMMIPLYVVFYISFRCFRTPRQQALALFLASSLLWFFPNAMPSLKNQQIYSLFAGTMLSVHYESVHAFVQRWRPARLLAALLMACLPLYPLSHRVRWTALGDVVTPVLMNATLVGLSLSLMLVIVCIENLNVLRPAWRAGVGRILSVLALCGAMSYEIYICHGPLEWIVRDEHFFLSRLLFLAIAVCAAWLLFAAKSVLFRTLQRVTQA